MAKEGNGSFSGIFSRKKEEELPPGGDAPQSAAGQDSAIGQDTISEQTANQQAATDEKHDALPRKVAELESTVGQLKDQLLRKAAEFDNYKKRVEGELITRIQFANERLLGELIPVVDDFERSLKMSKGSKDPEAVYNGVEMIYQKLMKVLSAQGLKPFDSAGKPFNTDVHDALMQMPRKGVPPNTVIEEVEKGYTLHDRVLRHAKVIVAGEEPAPSADSGATPVPPAQA